MNSFMQNKPNFPDAQMNITSVKTMNYEQITMNNANKNKPNFRKAKMKLNFYSTKDYENKPRLRTPLRVTTVCRGAFVSGAGLYRGARVGQWSVREL